MPFVFNDATQDWFWRDDSAPAAVATVTPVTVTPAVAAAAPAPSVNWTPSSSLDYLASSGKLNEFYARYPNALGAQNAGTWATMYLEANNIFPAGNINQASGLTNLPAAIAEEKAISNRKNQTTTANTNASLAAAGTLVKPPPPTVATAAPAPVTPAQPAVHDVGQETFFPTVNAAPVTVQLPPATPNAGTGLPAFSSPVAVTDYKPAPASRIDGGTNLTTFEYLDQHPVTGGQNNTTRPDAPSSMPIYRAADGTFKPGAAPSGKSPLYDSFVSGLATAAGSVVQQRANLAAGTLANNYTPKTAAAAPGTTTPAASNAVPIAIGVLVLAALAWKLA